MQEFVETKSDDMSYAITPKDSDDDTLMRHDD